MKTITEEDIRNDLRYLQLLSQSYPTIADASTEIINLEAILNLPKPTEHFISDPHGESDAFNHVLRNASGYIRSKVEELFADTMTKREKQDLCMLIYYPEQVLELIHTKKRHNLQGFYVKTLNRLIILCREVSSKYTRSKVRKALPKEFEYVIEELLNESAGSLGDKKHLYYNQIILTIIETRRADAFITELSKLIQRLAVDRLHILGDIYDRGPGAHLIMDTLMDYHHFDMVWGNHDIDWMGAAAGNRACICNVLRMSLRYGNQATLEDGYGINLLPLATFALETYGSDPCTQFRTEHLRPTDHQDEKSERLASMMHKAITVIQFKEEARLISQHPEYRMDGRRLINRINLTDGTIDIDGHTYALRDTNFPTVSADNPSLLTPEEESVMQRIGHSFLTSDRLHRHIALLLSHGSMFQVSNSNLMFHASVPLNKDGSLKEIEIFGKTYKGMELMKKVGRVVRSAFSADTKAEERQNAIDYLWYLWCGKESPLFDKDRMTTFERYFIDDTSAYTERKGYYYRYGDSTEVMDMILDDFGVTGEHRHIINGHVPVRTIKGETPIKAQGRHLVIDGGFSLAYQPKTGIAGYTLTFHSRGLELVQHYPFTTAGEAIRKGIDIRSKTQIVELSQNRMYVKDTDKGKQLKTKVEDLKKLLIAYRMGLIKQISR